MVRIRSCRLTAAISGGRWKRAPVSCWTHRWTAAVPPDGLECKRKMPTYSLPAFCWLFARRVVRSMQTMRQPETLGSSVPLWPVLSTRRIRLTHDTTSWDEGFDGLSRLMNPDRRYSRISRLYGEHPIGSGVKWKVRTFSLSKFCWINAKENVEPKTNTRQQKHTLSKRGHLSVGKAAAFSWDFSAKSLLRWISYMLNQMSNYLEKINYWSKLHQDRLQSARLPSSSSWSFSRLKWERKIDRYSKTKAQISV